MTRARFKRADGTSFFTDVDMPRPWPMWSRAEPEDDPPPFDFRLCCTRARIRHYECTVYFVPCGPIACPHPDHARAEVVYVESPSSAAT